jgi:hypothetical protein
MQYITTKPHLDVIGSSSGSIPIFYCVDRLFNNRCCSRWSVLCSGGKVYGHFDQPLRGASGRIFRF